MTKTAYQDPPNFKPETRALLAKIIEVVERYRQAGYRMTLRQLYYQLVVESVFANQQRNYAKLSDILGTARMSGLVDWDFIEDRLRRPRLPNEFEGVKDGLDTLIDAYRLDRWSGQKTKRRIFRFLRKNMSNGQRLAGLLTVMVGFFLLLSQNSISQQNVGPIPIPYLVILVGMLILYTSQRGAARRNL